MATIKTDLVGRMTEVETSEDRPAPIGGLADLRRQLADVMGELATMPKHKAGTDWHHDRVEDARWLVRTIERLSK